MFSKARDVCCLLWILGFIIIFKVVLWFYENDKKESTINETTISLDQELKDLSL